MKPLLTGIVTLVFFLFSQSILAQNSAAQKRAVFQHNSEKVPAAIQELGKAFSAAEGSVVTFHFREIQFEGTVISSVKKYENLHSVIIKNNKTNTLLSFSKRTNDDGTHAYVGRILNDRSTDGYELVQNTDGTYTFHKIQTEDLIQDK